MQHKNEGTFEAKRDRKLQLLELFCLRCVATENQVNRWGCDDQYSHVRLIIGLPWNRKVTVAAIIAVGGVRENIFLGIARISNKYSEL